MRSSFFSAAFLALASIVSAQTDGFDVLTVPTQDQTIAAGKTLDITWTPSAGYTGPVTITLLQGATTATLALGDVITTIASTAGTYSWVIPTTLQPFATYGFKLTNDSDTTGTIFQYSFPFHITGLDSSASSTASPTTLTLHLSTGTAYTTSTTSSSSIYSSVTPSASSNTSTIACTSSSAFFNTTTTTASATFSSTAVATNNVTLSATLTPVPSKTNVGPTNTNTATTTSAPPVQSTSAAIANIARGSMAILGGLALAFAL